MKLKDQSMFISITLNYLQLLKQVSEYVMGLFNQCFPDDLCYHSINHTKSVVKRAYETAATYTLTESDYLF